VQALNATAATQRIRRLLPWQLTRLQHFANRRFRSAERLAFSREVPSVARASSGATSEFGSNRRFVGGRKQAHHWLDSWVTRIK
jgi:hypothetical protein